MTRGKTHASGKLLFAARVIPYRGSWLDFEFDAKDIVHVRIDRRRKLPVTTLLKALGLDAEEILELFYAHVPFTLKDGEWTAPFNEEQMIGVKLTHDLVDAKSGGVVAELGRKMTPRLARKLKEEGLETLRVSLDELIGRFFALDVVNMETGEIYAEAGDEVTAEILETLVEIGMTDLTVLDIDHINKGAFIRNTLAAEQNR